MVKELEQIMSKRTEDKGGAGNLQRQQNRRRQELLDGELQRDRGGALGHGRSRFLQKSDESDGGEYLYGGGSARGARSEPNPPRIWIGIGLQEEHVWSKVMTDGPDRSATESRKQN
jgi:hypothetical protein